MEIQSRRARAQKRQKTSIRVESNSRSLKKIQPKNNSKKSFNKTKDRKIYSRNPFQSLLLKLGGLFALVFLAYLLFFFEFPANYPKDYSVKEITLNAAQIQIEFYSDRYKKQLIPLEFLLKLAQGEITTVGVEEKKIEFADGKTILLTEGSRKILIGNKKVKFDAPVMTIEGMTLIPGELIEELYPKVAKFKDGIATYHLSDQKPKGDFLQFTGEEGYLRLVNGDNPLPKEYIPKDLVNMNTYKTITAYGNNTNLRTEAAEALAKMYKENAVPYIMSSGFRDYDTQTILYNDKVAQYLGMGYSDERAKAQAGTIVALPGTSEHQVGLAVDFSIPGVLLTENFKNTEAGQWLSANSYKYGFVLRYTEAQTAVTKIIYEPWHFRYIGYPHSEILVKDGIVFDTYINGLREDKYRFYKGDNGTSYLIWLLDGKLKPESLKYNTEFGVGVSTDNKEGIILTLPYQ